MKIELQTTMAEFEELHEKLDRTRANTIEIKVPRVALQHLTEDYRTMTAATKDETPKLVFKSWQEIKTLVLAQSPSTRKNSKLMTVDKKLVMGLLIDHSVLIGKLEEMGYSV